MARRHRRIWKQWGIPRWWQIQNPAPFDLFYLFRGRLMTRPDFSQMEQFHPIEITFLSLKG